MKRSIAAAAAGWAALTLACHGGAPQPAPLDTRNDACASCRMAVSDARFASQVVAPGELPRFFDDLACLGAWLKRKGPQRHRAVFVADHRTRAWVRAEEAVYTRVDGLETPMGSHLLAHASAASRERDREATTGTPVSATELFGPVGAPAEGAK